MTCAEAGRKGGKASGLARLKKSRGALAHCKTVEDVLRFVVDAEQRAYQRGWQAGKRARRRLDSKQRSG